MSGSLRCVAMTQPSHVFTAKRDTAVLAAMSVIKQVFIWKAEIVAVSSRDKCFLFCGRRSRFLDQVSAEIQRSMREYRRGAAGGGPPELTKASLRFLVLHQVPELRSPLTELRPRQKEQIWSSGNSIVIAAAQVRFR